MITFWIADRFVFEKTVFLNNLSIFEYETNDTLFILKFIISYN